MRKKTLEEKKNPDKGPVQLMGGGKVGRGIDRFLYLFGQKSPKRRKIV